MSANSPPPSRVRQRFTRDEIIEILKRNMPVFRDDEVFVQYIVDLATYLVEYRIHLTEASEKARSVVSEHAETKRESLAKTRARDVELLGVLIKHASKTDAKAMCRMCGAPTEGRMICYHCGNMVF